MDRQWIMVRLWIYNFKTFIIVDQAIGWKICDHHGIRRIRSSEEDYKVTVHRPDIMNRSTKGDHSTQRS
ncbi:hypothetical protein LSAT2_011545, partial [Lamellibrachia satsuma]